MVVSGIVRIAESGGKGHGRHLPNRYMQFAADHIRVRFQQKELFMLKVTSLEDRKPEYPRLKISPYNGLIVLFSAPYTGTVLDPGESTTVKGEHSNYWAEKERFINFFGSVTLSETKD